MKRFPWYLKLALILLIIGFFTYLIQVQIFNTPDQTLFYFFQDLAFLPLEVLLVTILIDRLMKRREKSAILKKMNMVIGIFFSEMGVEVLRQMAVMDLKHPGEVQGTIQRVAEEKPGSVEKKGGTEAVKKYRMDTGDSLLRELRDLLSNKRSCLMRILENPNLLEHESFSDMLWALSHLTEELMLHRDFTGLSEEDREHLKKDLVRAYSRLIKEWGFYLKHLKSDYPYIFSLYCRKNPLKIPTGK